MPISATLSDLAARALSLADAERWNVAAQATNGERAVISVGRPGYTLVLYLSDAARDADALADADRPARPARPAPPALPTPCPPVPLLPLPPLA